MLAPTSASPAPINQGESSLCESWASSTANRPARPKVRKLASALGLRSRSSPINRLMGSAVR
jgi:hypothetical protein